MEPWMGVLIFIVGCFLIFFAAASPLLDDVRFPYSSRKKNKTMNDFPRGNEEVKDLVIGQGVFIFTDIYEEDVKTQIFLSEEDRDATVKDFIYTLMEAEGFKVDRDDNQTELANIHALFEKGWFKDAIEAAEEFHSSRFILAETTLR